MCRSKALLNVRPRLSVNHISDGRSADAKPPRERRDRDLARREESSDAANLPHIAFGQPCAAISRTAPPALRLGVSPMSLSSGRATLLVSVGSVLRLGAEPEMRRSNAPWVVATRTVVKRAQTSGNGSVVQLPRQAVSIHHLPVFADEHAMLAARCPCPEPTLAALVNLFPERGNAFLCRILAWHRDPLTSLGVGRQKS